MNACDYYKLLGVSRFASQETIKRAFNSQIIDIHPDQNPGNALALEHTRDLVEAYKILRDPKTRHEYDLAISSAFLPEIMPEIMPEIPTARSRFISPTVTHLFNAMLAVFLIVFVGIVLMQAVISNREWVIRPLFPDVKYPLVCKSFPMVVEPGVYHSMEWYQAQQYQLSLANGWATHEMVNVYTRAADRAIKQGNRAGAEFYRSVIRNSRGDTDTVIL